MALISSINAEIEAMKCANIKRIVSNKNITYLEKDFLIKSRELRIIANSIQEDNKNV